MANTKIQIKRSAVTDTPGSLDVGELAYSYSSNTLFIGNTSGGGVIAIGGFSLSTSANNYAGAMANAANGYANTVGTSGNAYADVVGASGNAYVNVVGASGNAYANVVGDSANNYAGFMANSVNAWATSTFVDVSGDTMSGDLVIQGNLTVTGETTYVNTQTLLVGDNIFVLNSDLDGATAPSQDAGMEVNRGSAANVSVLWDEAADKWTFTNDGTIYQSIVGNTSLESVAASANGYAVEVGASGNAYANLVSLSANNYAGFMANAVNAWANTVGTSGNAYADFVGLSANNYAGFMANAANSYANTVGSSGNAYADVVGAAANTNAANGSYINTGIVKVPYGGTGMTSFTQNGVLFGNTNGDLKVTTAGVEGNVLQVNDQGVPLFGMLDGGSF